MRKIRKRRENPSVEREDTKSRHENERKTIEESNNARIRGTLRYQRQMDGGGPRTRNTA
jgi:hypothetical protein